jgi:hypothetical protein
MRLATGRRTAGYSMAFMSRASPTRTLSTNDPPSAYLCVCARAPACASVSSHLSDSMEGRESCGTAPRACVRIASVAHCQSRTLFVACSLRSMTSWPVCQVTCVVHRMLHVPRSMLRYLGCASVGFRPPYQCAQSSPVVSHSNADEITCRATPGSVRKAKPGSGPQVSS